MNQELNQVAVGDCLTKLPRQLKVKTSAYLDSGFIPVIDQGSVFIGGYVNDPTLAYSGPLPVVVFGDHNRNIKFVKKQFAVGADGTQLLYPDERFDVAYFYYALKALPLKHYGYERHFKYLKEEKIWLWPKPLQRRIASILSAYDDLIENNTRRIAILEEMARRIYEEWFVRFRFPGHENVRMVESELGLVPDGWTVEPLGDVCDVTDYVANGSFASLKENVTYCDEKDYAVLVRGTDFNAGWNGKYVYVTEHSYRFLRKSSLKPGDIVVTNVGNVGITFLVPDLAQPMTLGPNSVLARPKKGRMYMFLFLRSDEGQHRINGITSGAAQPKFNKTEFRNLRIALPAQEQLDLFEATAGPFHLLAEKLRQSNANLRTTRDLLLPKLISGELDVSNIPEPEIAAA